MTQVLPPTPRPTAPPTPPAPPFFPPTPHRSPASARPRRAGFAAAVLTGALLVGGGAGVGGAALYDAVADRPSTGGSSAPLQVVDSGDRRAATGSVESVASGVLPSVVALDVTAGGGASGPGGSGGGAGSGSGVVIDASGLILTNDHVVSLGGQTDPREAEVTASFNDGRKAKATVVGTDPLTDTALLQVEGVDDLKPVTIGKSGNLDVGEQVVAIGSPFGLDATVTSGIVSAVDRPVEVARDESGRSVAYPAIQTDAAINPGNSGGPLVNMDGQLVGINASIRTAGSVNGAAAGSIGLGFAIPIDEVLPIIEQLRAGETPTHARLGIQVANTPDGARVEAIDKGSAAAEAGLRAGDVITGIDDRQIDGTEDLIATVRSFRPGDTVEVTYRRGGDERTTDLELGSDG
ncbi:S1C family serine protease [Nocardioides sp. SYSU DS0651]|uniref:S1C family serine protease n=1 Tax=Nocardioides sp. SYSU DS0651 TaxID=3415955 RepID=UPI003F4B57CC